MSAFYEIIGGYKMRDRIYATMCQLKIITAVRPTNHIYHSVKIISQNGSIPLAPVRDYTHTHTQK